MDKLKLKWRVFAFLLGFCALLIAILWFFQTMLLTESYKLIRKAEIGQAIALVEKNINSPDLQAILTELGESREIMVMPTQEFVPPNPPDMSDRPDMRNPNRRQPETVTETMEFTQSDGKTVSLTFHAMVTPVDATVSTLRFQLYIISAIMLLCAVILAVIIARRVSKPIEEISAGAKALAAGNYGTHFSGHGFLEIKELSDTLNTAARELSKVDALRRELMANVSHDLRTPLSLIYSYAEMMHDFPGEVTPEQSETIMNEVLRLSSLVNDILDASRLETGDIKLTLSTYNLTESIRDTAARTAELVKTDGYRVLFEHDREVYVKADEIKLTQAFYNLLTNAIHYSAEDKNIIVRQEISENKVKISVIDRGDGIAPEDLPNIWNRYYKGRKAHKRALAGTGLGLSIVKEIIKLHGGACGVTSEPGKGSTFWFELNMA